MQASNLMIQRFDTAEAFLDSCLDWLLETGVANSSLVIVVQSIAAGKSDFGGEHWFSMVSEGKGVRGCAIHEALDGLMTTRLPEGAHSILASEIAAHGIDVRKIYGPEPDSTKLASLLCAKKSLDWTVTHRWVCYTTAEIIQPPRMAKGRLRQASEDERDLILAWAEAYGEEKPAPIPVKDFILKKMKDRDLYVWDDNGPKAMLSVSGGHDTGARISAVYTPPELRERGYASSLVAVLVSMKLRNGHRCASLFVENEETHLHRLYSRLGFEIDGSRSNIVLAES